MAAAFRLGAGIHLHDSAFAQTQGGVDHAGLGHDVPIWHHGEMGSPASSTIALHDDGPAGDDFFWVLGYFYPPSHLVPHDGDSVRVIRFGWITSGPVFHNGTVRLVNVSGVPKWGFFDDSDDSQFGSYSAAQSLGAGLTVGFRHDFAGDLLEFFVGGSSVVSASGGTGDALSTGLSTGGPSTVDAWWSGFQLWRGTAVGDVDMTHFTEGPYIMHPTSDGAHTDYNNAVTDLDDLVAGGSNDGDSSFMEGNDGANVRQTWVMSNSPTFSNTIQGVYGAMRLRQDFDIKTAVHGALWHLSGTDEVISRGSEDMGLLYKTHGYYLHTKPGGGGFSLADLDALQFGHRRSAGSTAFNYRITAAHMAAWGYGSTSKLPALPEILTSLPASSRRYYPVLRRGGN